MSGEVTISVLVSDQGDPLDVALVKSSGNDLLDRAGLANVRQWTFYPRLVAGKAVESRLTVTVVFRSVP
jgi:TonB family protein